MSDDKEKPVEYTLLGNMSDMTEDELIESVMAFIESKVGEKKDSE